MSLPPPPSQPPPGQPPSNQPPFQNYPPPGGAGPMGGSGFGPPGSGGFGPPGSAPPPGGNSRRTVVAIVVAAVVAIALITGAVLVFQGDGENAEASDSNSPTVSDSSSEPLPTDSDEPDDYPTDDYPDDDYPTDDYPDDDYPTDDYPTDEESPRDFEDIMPTPSDGPRPAFQMEVGDCFDISGKKGRGEPVECSSAHDAEVVHQEKLDKDYDTDSEVRKEADQLCKSPMQDAAQGESAVGGTLVQYPKASGVQMGMRTVTCSLTAGKGKKLYEAL